jgi:hypothetical protein
MALKNQNRVETGSGIRKRYRAPSVRSQATAAPSVLLICTGEYNCVNEVGYDCCQANADTCFTNC